MEFTVENVCGLLIKSKLLTPEGVKVVYERWVKESGSAVNNLAAFIRWLVSQQVVTEYQAALVAKGHTDAFFLDQYKILERLGRGRTAGVYKALHNLGQTVAIKILPPSRVRNPKQLSRFQREVQLALQLKHPNVVRSFQVGEAAGVHYLVMEYLEGETLNDVLKRRKRIPLPEAARLIHQALLGLQHIHQLGLVHRDMKPANLMVVPGTAGQEPDNTLRSTLKILDIGLGRLTQGNARRPDNAHLTSLGALLGTPDYLAPEQARDPRGVDIRADLYSLGCVLYLALTGQPPFPDTNLLSLMVRHATEPPKPVRELNPALPESLQPVINTLLAKEPDKRYATPGHAILALHPFLTNSSEAARPAEEEPQLRRYLTWLDTDQKKENAAPPLAGLIKQREKQRALKRLRKYRKQQQAGMAPAATPPRESVARRDIDVELVAVPPVVPPPKPRLGLRLRDWLFFIIGAMLVLGAGFAALMATGVIRVP